MHLLICCKVFLNLFTFKWKKQQRTYMYIKGEPFAHTVEVLWKKSLSIQLDTAEL